MTLPGSARASRAGFGALAETPLRTATAINKQRGQTAPRGHRKKSALARAPMPTREGACAP